MTEIDPAPVAPPEPHDQAEDTRRRRGAIPLVLRWIGGVLGALILAIVIFLLLFNWDWFRPPLARLLSARLHRPVRIVGHLNVHLFSWTPTVTLGGLEIGEPDWLTKSGRGPKKDFADFQMITVKMKLIPLLTGHVVLPLVRLDRPQIAMFQDKGGKSNWDFSNGQKPGKPTKLPPIQDFLINDGTLDITSLQRKLTFSGTVNAREAQGGGGREGFGLNGTGQLNGKPFHMNVTGGPLLNVKHDVPYPFDAVVSAGETTVTAKGQVPHPFDLGHIYGDVSMKGHDLADLYYLTGVALPNTPPYSIAGHLDRENRVYRFDNFTGRVGSSDLEGSLKADMSNPDNRPDLTGALRSRRLDFKDLGSLFGATGANKPAGPKLAIGAPKPGANNRLLPDASLDASRVRAMDAHVTYRADTVVAAPTLPLRAVSLGVDLNHGLLTLDPIDFSFPQGRMSGNASIDARTALQKNAVDLRLNGVQLQNFMPKGKTAGPPPIEGPLDAHAKLAGDGNTVHKAAATSDGRVVAVIPGGVVRQAFAELLGVDASKGLIMLLGKNQKQTNIRCAVADFQVQNGVLHARQLVIDTDVVRVDGTGDINLNDETFNLTLKGHPKHFRLFTLKTPITIGGHLSSPTFGVKPLGGIAQAGLGAALGAVVFPPLAILPFVDLGGAHNADCTAALQDAKAAGAPVKRSQVVNAPHAGPPA